MIGGSLFAGIGGFDLAMRRAGIPVAWHAEIDPWCLRVLSHHFPEATAYDDVRLVGADAAPIDLLAGGFPCQDLSTAGRRAGLAGERSGLFFEVVRVAAALRPRWILLENVPGLLSSQRGADFATVLGALDELGYGVAWRVLDSQGFGVPQRRRRVFVVCHLGAEPASEVLALSEGLRGHPAPSGEARTGAPLAVGGSATGGRLAGTLTAENARSAAREHAAVVAFHAPGLAAPLSKGSAASPGVNQAGRRQEDDVNLVAAFAFHENSRHELRETPIAGSLSTGGGAPGQGYAAARIGSVVRRLTPTECERLQGFPDGWTAIDGEPDYQQTPSGAWRCKTGTPDSPRYAALGNAVTVNTVEWIIRRIVAADLLGLGRIAA